MSFHYLYVLLSLKDNKFYIGSTNDLKRRLQEHQQGKNISTAKRRPLKLIFYEAYPTKSDAERREGYFKTDKGKTTLRQMLRGYLEQKEQSEISDAEYLPLGLEADLKL